MFALKVYLVLVTLALALALGYLVGLTDETIWRDWYWMSRKEGWYEW